MSNYPPGVSGWMIDEYFRDDEQPSCETCSRRDSKWCKKGILDEACGNWEEVDEDDTV